MLDGASRGGFAFPAVNVTSSATLNGALAGFAEAGSDGIVEITVGGARHLGGDPARGARALAALARVVAEEAPVLLALHTDHCPPEHVDAFVRPLLAESRTRAGG